MHPLYMEYRHIFDMHKYENVLKLEGKYTQDALLSSSQTGQKNTVVAAKSRTDY